MDQKVPAKSDSHPVRICSVDGCARRHKAKGLCKPHHHRQLHGGDLTTLIGLRSTRFQPGFSGILSPRWRGDGVGYIGVHKRVRRTRGPAGQQSCAHCSGPAKHWAYDHTDPNPLMDRRGCPYSPDVNRYMALCRSCHRLFDLAHARKAR